MINKQFINQKREASMYTESDKKNYLHAFLKCKII